MSVKRGDVVLYTQGGRSYNALVLAVHALNASHLGADQEPQLHLSVLFDEPKGKVASIGFIPEPTTVHDIVHASHKFDADYLEARGLSQRLSAEQKVIVTAEIHSHRGAGEWSFLRNGMSDEALSEVLTENEKLRNEVAILYAGNTLKGGTVDGADMGRGTATMPESFPDAGRGRALRRDEL